MRREFEEYVDRMRKIRLLSTPPLESIADAGDYCQTLLHNFQAIGEMAGKSRQTVNDVLLPLLQSQTPLTENEVEELEELNRLLLDDRECYELDHHMADLIGDRLVSQSNPTEEIADGERDSEEYILNLGKKMRIKYYRMITTENSNPAASEQLRAEGLDALRILETYMEKDRFGALSMQLRKFVFQSVANEALLYQTYMSEHKTAYRQKMMQSIKRSFDRMRDPDYRELMPDYDWKTFEFMLYDRVGTLAGDPKMPLREAQEIYAYMVRMEKLWDKDAAHYLKYFPNYSDTLVKQQLLYAAIRAEDPSVEDRIRQLFSLYDARNAADYSWQGMEANLDLAIGLYTLFTGSYYADRQLSEEQIDTMDRLADDILGYVHRMPKKNMLVDQMLLYNKFLHTFKEYPGRLTFGDLCIQSLAAIHPPTYIHANMVARISLCLARHLLEKMPEVLRNFLGAGNAQAVQAKREDILHYVYHAALYHDIGKLTVVDTIEMYGRPLLASEFHNLQMHPDNGARLAEKHRSTLSYVDVIRGHHRWYDDTKGYPADFVTAKSPYKAVIDIVTVADCLDAATDSVGRSYSRGKTFQEFEQEVAEGAGTRYAPFWPQLFRDEALRADIRYLLNVERLKLYRETFLLLKNMQAG